MGKVKPPAELWKIKYFNIIIHRKLTLNLKKLWRNSRTGSKPGTFECSEMQILKLKLKRGLTYVAKVSKKQISTA